MRWIGAAILLAVFGGAEAKAQIVAFGASGTQGFGVAQSEAFPAQLEGLLRKRGINVAVSNQGISGDTTAGMLNRLDSAVPDGTRVVIFDSPAANDGNNGKKAHSGVIDHDGNVRTIIERLRARGIAVVALGPATDAPIAESAGASYCGRLYQGVAQEDLAGPRAGMIHPNPKGHAAIAARILPCAMRALGKKG